MSNLGSERFVEADCCMLWSAIVYLNRNLLSPVENIFQEFYKYSLDHEFFSMLLKAFSFWKIKWLFNFLTLDTLLGWHCITTELYVLVNSSFPYHQMSHSGNEICALKVYQLSTYITFQALNYILCPPIRRLPSCQPLKRWLPHGRDSCPACFARNSLLSENYLPLTRFREIWGLI